MATVRLFPLPALAENVLQDKRVAAQPLIDKGFAAVRQVGTGIYATISDVTKGFTTVCNGGFIIGREASLLIEGYSGPSGASFQYDALRSVSQLPVRAALDTHYHFDHSMGNTYYGAHEIPIFAHAKTPPLMIEKYANLQGQDKAPILAPLEKRVQDARDETERQHAISDLNAYKKIFAVIDKYMVGLPDHPLDPSKLPMTLDLGGTSAVIETYPGHTPTDIMVRVPEQNIVFTGDLLFNGWYPVAFDANISGWSDTRSLAITDGGIEVQVGDGMPGFIRKSDLSRDRSEQRPDRFAVGEKVDAKVTAVDKATRKLSLSIKAREVEEEKKAMAEYGSSDSGASLGDILGAALKKKTKDDDDSEG